MAEDELVIMFMPSLIDLLILLERNKGENLTEDEVYKIRDQAVCMTIRKSEMLKIEESRGYRDINPENCWGEWVAYKKGIEY